MAFEEVAYTLSKFLKMKSHQCMLSKYDENPKLFDDIRSQIRHYDNCMYMFENGFTLAKHIADTTKFKLWDVLWELSYYGRHSGILIPKDGL